MIITAAAGFAFSSASASSSGSKNFRRRSTEGSFNGPCACPSPYLGFAHADRWGPASRQSREARLIEVPVERERLLDPEVPHHDEACAVREAPPLVLVALEVLDR